MKSISLRKEKAIRALLSAPTQAAASEQCGVPPRTLQNWMKEPDFIDAYNEALSQSSAAAWAKAISTQTEAVEALISVMKHPAEPGAANKRKAAQDLLKLGMEYYALMNMEKRIKRLEELQK